jgi:hypothetical protein
MRFFAHLHTAYSDGLLMPGDLDDADVVVACDHLIPTATIAMHLSDPRRFPLVAVEAYQDLGDPNGKLAHLTLIAFRSEGVRRLFSLIPRMPLQGWDWMREGLEGLIVTTSCMASPLHHAARGGGDEELLSRVSRMVEEAGGVFAVEVFPWDAGPSGELPNALWETARRFAGGRILPSSDFHLPEDPESWLAYRLALAARPERHDGRFLKAHPMKGGLGFYQKMREASAYVTRRWVAPIPDWLARLLPDGPILSFPLPEPPAGELAAYRAWALSQAEASGVLEGVRRELDILSAHPEALTYMALTWRVVQALQDANVLVRLRGSGAGSLLAWLMAPLTPNPQEWGAMFERFFNPYREGLPDLDLDVPDQGRAVEALRKAGFQVARLAAFRTLADPESAIREAALRLIGPGRRKEDAARDAQIIAKEFGVSADEIWRAAERLARMAYPVGLSVHPSGFVVIPPGWANEPALPMAPDWLGGMALISGDMTPWKVDLLNVDALRAYENELQHYLIWATGLLPDSEIPNTLGAGAAGVFQMGPAVIRRVKGLARPSLQARDVVQILAEERPGARGFLFQEDAMRAAAEAALRLGLGEEGSWRAADLARRWTAKADPAAWEELERMLAGQEDVLARLRDSGGYSFCLSHAMAAASLTIADMLALQEPPDSLLLLMDRAAHASGLERISVLFHLLVRAAQAGWRVRLDSGPSGVLEEEQVLLLGEDLIRDVSDLIKRADILLRLQAGLRAQVVAQVVGFSLDVLTAAAGVIARPRDGRSAIGAGCFIYAIKRESRLHEPLALALVTPWGSEGWVVTTRQDGSMVGLAVPGKGGEWKRVDYDTLLKDPRAIRLEDLLGRTKHVRSPDRNREG